MTASTPPEPGLHGHELYDLAELYDIAYDWDVTRELQFVLSCIEFYGRGEPASLLEPACGTGRNLACLGRMGLKALGYDLNPQTLDFAAQRLREEGLSGQCRVLHGDMASFRIPEHFDGAYTAINSFRYLISDEQVCGHFQALASMLHPGGVYVVDLSYAHPSRVRPRIIRWTARRGGTDIKVCWRTREDRSAGLSHETCTLDVAAAAGNRVIETRHLTRLWQPDEFRAMAEAGGFRLESIYSAGFKHLPDHPPPHGGLDNLYHVLVRMD